MEMKKSGLYEHTIFMENLIGSGQFGSVYKGQLPTAVKRICYTTYRREQAKQDEKLKQLASNEVELHKRIKTFGGHRNIVRFIDSVDDGSSFWIILEFCDLGDLGSYMLQNPPSFEQKIDIMAQCSAGLSHLHAKCEPPIVHGDIKPPNVLVKQEEGKVVMKLSDLAVRGPKSRVTGTKLYMPPEAFSAGTQHGNIGLAGDIFSLGLLMQVILLFEKSDPIMNPIAVSPEDCICIGQALSNGEKVQLFKDDVGEENTLLTNLKILINKMVLKSPAMRISITELNDELQKILSFEEPTDEALIEALKHHFEDLCYTLNTEELMSMMYTKEHLTHSEFEHLALRMESLQTLDKMKMLMDYLLKPGQRDKLPGLMKILHESHSDIFETLQQTKQGIIKGEIQMTDEDKTQVAMKALGGVVQEKTEGHEDMAKVSQDMTEVNQEMTGDHPGMTKVHVGMIEDHLLQMTGEDMIGTFEETVEMIDPGMYRAVEEGDLEKVRQSLENGQDVNSRDGDRKETLLMTAVKNDQIDMTILLLQYNADINARNIDQHTPLHITAKEGTVQTAALLIEKGADLEAKDTEGHTPLHITAKEGTVQTAALLIEKGADLEAKDTEGHTPLHITAKEGTVQTAALLIEKGADLEARNKYDQTPIAITESTAFAGLLLLRGAVLPHNHDQKINLLLQVWSRLQPNQILDMTDVWTNQQIGDSDLLEKFKYLPKDFQCHALFLFCDSVEIVPNLRNFKQFDNLLLLIISSHTVHTLEGLPNNIECMGIKANIEVLSKNCVHGNVTFKSLVTSLNLGSLKQPPEEILQRGKDAVLVYYENGHYVINARNRIALLGDTTAGKSSLVQSLISGSPYLTDIIDRTQVMDVMEWRVSDTEIYYIMDQGGHPIYDICTPYFITSRSTILIIHNLCDPGMNSRTLQVFQRTIHHHPENENISFGLSHIDELSDQEIQTHSATFKCSIEKLLQDEIDNLERLVNSPSGHNIENLTKTLAGCKSKLKSIHYFPFSNATYKGIDSLRQYLISHIEKQRITIPGQWIEFYNKIKASGCYFLDISQIQALWEVHDLNKKNWSIPFSSGLPKFSENELTCLHYLCDAGLLLWEEKHDILKQCFFHDLDFLISLFRSLFHHDLKSTLNYENDRDLQVNFNEAQLDHALKQYEQEGLLQHKLLQFLWKKYNLTITDESVFIQLIKMFHIFSEVVTNPKGTCSQIYFVPWLVKNNISPASLNLDKPMTFSKDTFTLTLQGLFHNHIPLNLVEMFGVDIQKFAVDREYFGKRYAWADGLHIKVGPQEIIVFKHHSARSMFLLVKGKPSSLAQTWSTFKSLYKALQTILHPYEGVTRSLHIICSHCSLHNIEPPHRWLPEQVFSENPNTNEYMICEKDDDCEIPTGLITYHPDNDITKQSELVKQYLQLCTTQQTTGFEQNVFSPVQNQPIGDDQGRHQGRDPSIKEILQINMEILRQQGMLSQALSTQMSQQGQALSTQMFDHGQALSSQMASQHRALAHQSMVHGNVLFQQGQTMSTQMRDDHVALAHQSMVHGRMLVLQGEAISTQMREDRATLVQQGESLATQLKDDNIELSKRIALQSSDASGLCLQTQHPVLSKHQQLLEEMLNPNGELLVNMTKHFLITQDEMEIILNDKSILGKVKRILVAVDSGSPPKVKEFIEALNDCSIGSSNRILADYLKDTYNKTHHPVLSEHQQLLEENLNPNEELLENMTIHNVITVDKMETILQDKSILGKVKRILVAVNSGNPPKVKEFIEALNDCGINSSNNSLAIHLKDAYNEYLKTQT